MLVKIDRESQEHPPAANLVVAYEQLGGTLTSLIFAGKHAFKGGSKSGDGGTASYLSKYPILLAIEIDYNQVPTPVLAGHSSAFVACQQMPPVLYHFGDVLSSSLS